MRRGCPRQSEQLRRRGHSTSACGGCTDISVLHNLFHQIFHFLHPTPSWLRHCPCVHGNLCKAGPHHPLPISSVLPRLPVQTSSLSLQLRVRGSRRFPLMVPVPTFPALSLVHSSLSLVHYFTLSWLSPPTPFIFSRAVMPLQQTCPSLRTDSRTSFFTCLLVLS